MSGFAAGELRVGQRCLVPTNTCNTHYAQGVVSWVSKDGLVVEVSSGRKGVRSCGISRLRRA